MGINTLYLSYDGMTDPLGQSQVLPYLTGLCKKGYHITLISFEKPEVFEARKSVVENICQEYGIDWHPLPYTKKPPILSTVKDVRKMRRLACKLHHSKKFSLVHCRSYITSMIGSYMKSKLNVPYIFDMRGFWADERVDGKLWNIDNWLYKRIYTFFKKKEKQFLQEASAIISLTHNAKDELSTWTDIRQPLPVHVIPCCVDLELFDPAKLDKEGIRRQKEKLEIPDECMVLTYIGSIGTWYMLDEMLDFFKIWLINNPKAVFVFVTTEPGNTILMSAGKKGIDHSKIRIISAQRKEMPLYVAISDYSVFFIKPAYSKKASSPTKQAEIMAMGIPVICNAGVGDTDTVIRRYSAGVIVESFDKSAYEKAVETASRQQWEKQKIREGAAEFFSLEKGVATYAGAYDKIIEGR